MENKIVIEGFSFGETKEDVVIENTVVSQEVEEKINYFAKDIKVNKHDSVEDMISSMRAELKVLLETFYGCGIFTHNSGDVHGIIGKFLNKENLLIEIDWLDY